MNFFKTIVFLLFFVIFKVKTIHPYLQTTHVVYTCCILQTKPVVSYKQSMFILRTSLVYLTNKTCRISQTKPFVSYTQNLLYLTNKTCCILQTKPVVFYKRNLLYLTKKTCCILQKKTFNVVTS